MNDFNAYYGDEASNVIGFFMDTPGCYLVRAEGSIGLAYRCDKEDYSTVQPHGKDLYVQWCSGDWGWLLNLVEGPESVLFHRRDELKCYKFDTLRRHSVK